MNNKRAKEIRNIMMLPRLSKDWTPEQTRLYGQIKDEYIEANKKVGGGEKFLEALSLFSKTMSQVNNK